MEAAAAVALLAVVGRRYRRRRHLPSAWAFKPTPRAELLTALAFAIGLLIAAAGRFFAS